MGQVKYIIRSCTFFMRSRDGTYVKQYVTDKPAICIGNCSAFVCRNRRQLYKEQTT